MKRDSFHRPAVCAAIIAMFASTLAANRSVDAQARPDLRVAAIRTPGGLCVGNTNKVQATIQNSQNIGVNVPVKVALRIQFPNGGQGSYETTIQSGIGPNGNQPAWFHNVSLPATGAYSVTVFVDPPASNLPNGSIAESVENNNSRSQSFTVQNNCGSPAPARTYTLTVRVYETGTWSGGQGQWIQGATVSLQDHGNDQFNPRTATTNANGQAIFNNVPASRPLKPYLIIASRQGCQQVQGTGAEAPSSKKFMMGAYNSTQNLSLDCNK